MVQCTLTVKLIPNQDSYSRYHGLTIDMVLLPTFWVSQTNAIIGTDSASFEYTKVVDLDYGNHYLMYGNSASEGNKWDIVVKIDGVEINHGSGVDRYNYFRLDFTIEKPEPVELNWWWLVLLISGEAIFTGSYFIIMDTKEGKKKYEKKG